MPYSVNLAITVITVKVGGEWCQMPLTTPWTQQQQSPCC